MRGGRQESSNSSIDVDSIELSLSGEHHGAPSPENEAERIEFLWKLNILDTVTEDSFDFITRLLTDIFQVPVALVSLVDSNRQWFKSVVGLKVRETPREMSFCAHLFLTDEPEILLVPDAKKDSRFRNNPLVTGDPYIRFYCGAPIILDGVRLGSLCIIDRVPRDTMRSKDAMLLANLADAVAGLVDRERVQAHRCDMLDNPTFLVEVTGKQCPILYMNAHGKSLIENFLGDTPGFLDLFDLSLELDTMRSETRVYDAMFRGERKCLCTFHPASRHGFGQDLQNQIRFSYNEPSKSAMLNVNTPKADKPEAEYNFVVVKWMKEGDSAFQRSDSGLKPLEKDGEATPAPGPKISEMFSIQTDDDLEAALKAERCVVMLTSHFCGACVHFLEFYKVSCALTHDVQFCAVSVDDNPDIARKCSMSPIFLPSVYFYKKGEEVDRLSGSHCALFRRKLGVLSSNDNEDKVDTVDIISSNQSETLSEASGSFSNVLTGVVDRHRDRMVVDLNMRLEAERAYSRSLEMSLSGSMSAQLMELRKDHEESQARIELLKRNLKTRKKSKPVLRGLSTIINEAEESSQGEEEFNGAEVTQTRQMLPNYQFSGTLRKFLQPLLISCRVLIYGSHRADPLEGGMRQLGLDVARMSPAQREAIPTTGRHGRRLAILDVIDSRSPQATWEWFEKVSDVLTTGGILATVSVDFDILEILGMLGESYGWAVTCTEGSKKDYGIIVLTKGPDSDKMLEAWCIASLNESMASCDWS